MSPSPRGVILVQGTKGWRQRWWTPGSAFVRHLEEHGFELILGPHGKPFRWTTALNGWRFWRRWFGRAEEHRDWIAGGEALATFLAWLRAGGKYAPADAHEHANIITHSHGIWAAMLAAASGARIRCLMTLAPPGRADMRDVIERARPNIQYWGLCVDRDTDLWAALGGIGDGKLGVDREFSFLPPEARPDLIIGFKAVGHSKLLEESGAYLWDDHGLFDQLHLAGKMPEKAPANV